MKRIAVGILCICLLFTVGVLCPVSAYADQPTQDDIFHDEPGGNEYSDNTTPQPTENGLSGGTIAVISIAAIAVALGIGVWIYHIMHKKKK